jgi:hypothetical protein
MDNEVLGEWLFGGMWGRRSPTSGLAVALGANHTAATLLVMHDRDHHITRNPSRYQHDISRPTPCGWFLGVKTTSRQIANIVEAQVEGQKDCVPTIVGAGEGSHRA